MLMKNFVFYLLLLGFASAAALTGCVHRRVYVASSSTVVATPPAETVISEAPPATPQEVIVASPGPGYYWVPGYWSWQGRWVWVRGAWAIRPHPRAVYIPGRWVHRGHGYVWINGHWR
jgi:hypothetical protein